MFTLYDISGKKVFQKQLHNPGSQTIDCGVLSAGTYTAELSGNDKKFVRKIVVNK